MSDLHGLLLHKEIASCDLFLSISLENREFEGIAEFIVLFKVHLIFPSFSSAPRTFRQRDHDW